MASGFQTSAMALANHRAPWVIKGVSTEKEKYIRTSEEDREQNGG